MCSGVLAESEAAAQPASSYAAPNARVRVTFGRELVRAALGASRRRILKVSHASEVAVDQVDGAYMLVEREYLLSNPMDERFELYYEDVEFCDRARERGGVSLVGMVCGVHAGGQRIRTGCIVREATQKSYDLLDAELFPDSSSHLVAAVLGRICGTHIGRSTVQRISRRKSKSAAQSDRTRLRREGSPRGVSPLPPMAISDSRVLLAAPRQRNQDCIDRQGREGSADGPPYIDRREVDET